ncbi:MFS general substrate transporter [Aureobasidium pullulans]|nr:MFS general substrate transporter [Aureobasidium pullulans]
MPPPPPDLEKSSAPLPDPSDLTKYPEGGTRAWLVVLGAWCGLTASIGLYNTTGVFSVIISNTILTSSSSTSIGWIFSIYAFMDFDDGGDVLYSAWDDVFEFLYRWIFLAFSLLTGLGSSLLLTPSMACVAHWFDVRRGLASGVAWTGGGVGGVLFSLLIQGLLPHIGWAWCIRITAFILLFLCIISILLCRSRISPSPHKNATSPWRATLPDYHIFLDGTGAMAFTTLGVLFVDLAYFIPITYLPSYYLSRQDLPTSSTISGSAAFGYQLLAILNASSCFGRLISGSLGDHFGHYNTMIISLLLCVLSIFALWLPDIVIPSASSSDSPIFLIIFVIIFGFVSGSNVSLTPICLGQLCDIRDYGRYYASCYTVVAFGVLVSLPAAGGILDVCGGGGGKGGKGDFWGVAVFTVVVGASRLCFITDTALGLLAPPVQHPDRSVPRPLSG